MVSKDMAVYMKARREARRQALIQQLGGCCQQCGSTDQLQFDHRDRTTKAFELSGHHLDKPILLIQAEAVKCDLLCYVCHNTKTINSAEYYNGPKAQEFTHGTARMYLEKACRCADCRKARSVHRKGQLNYNEVYC